MRVRSAGLHERRVTAVIALLRRREQATKAKKNNGRYDALTKISVGLTSKISRAPRTSRLNRKTHKASSSTPSSSSSSTIVEVGSHMSETGEKEKKKALPGLLARFYSPSVTGVQRGRDANFGMLSAVSSISCRRLQSTTAVVWSTTTTKIVNKEYPEPGIYLVALRSRRRATSPWRSSIIGERI